MFESLFPIFCFGVVITAIVAKGLFMAAEFAKSEMAPPRPVESPESLFANRSYPFPNGSGDESEQPSRHR